MNLLKKIPIRFTGELHDVKLVNFYIDMRELDGLVPGNIAVRDFHGRAMISMVNVMLRKMHPEIIPGLGYFDYRHIAFRLLVEDAGLNGGTNKGIFFLKSFTDQPVIMQAGGLLTDYNLELAEIRCIDRMLELNQGEKKISYALDLSAAGKPDRNLLETVSTLDRAYSAAGNELRMVRIMRERWPLRPVDCYHFETNFFETAELAGVFVVDDTIRYEWLPAENIRPCA
ncbi:MAG: hypothetical protein FD123_300 [Bacteroidetes bacterium]|nr:MAG: hypothetical protein FD123_300 [Bacteroidota bacterium]